MSYKDTSLWKRTLGKEDKNVEPLRESYSDARKNAQFLLDKIRKDFPNLTVHDITHVDSLWNVADTIIGEKYPINPLEGYILGIAFLIHDAALSYDAVGGKDKLRDTIEWKDAYADGPGDKDEEEFKKECDFVAIRALHAKYAENLLFQTFIKNNGSTFFIIDNDSIRTHFGNLIGKVAASHHWSIDDVELKLKKPTNPLNEMPKEWKVNARKLACILRCADAGHIDNGRAPDSIYQSLVVNGVSRQHWESQNHLCQVCEDEFDPTKLCITSSHPFVYERKDMNNKKEDIAAWNVAYDAVRLFDEELKKSNDLLKRITPNSSVDLTFPHVGVSGVDSKEALAKYIETEGWQPCSFGVHTSNVKALIENLGGSKLYGEDDMLLVALRELIQNARDAIQARKKLDEGFDKGHITIRFRDGLVEPWIELEDNGIGMSMDCIKHCLLDFGSSYWKSSLAKYENPGLMSKGFRSIGKYGIGFYSVFMVAESVEVVTRRYDKGKDDAKRIEFPAGLTLSPILSEVKQDTSVSTIVKLELKENVNLNFYLHECLEPYQLKKILQLLVAGLDVDVYYFGNNDPDCIDTPICIHRSINSLYFDKKKWLEDLFLKTVPGEIIEHVANSLDVIKDDKGDVMAIIAIPDIDGKYIKNKCEDFGLYYDKIIIPSIETNCGLSISLEGDAIDKGFVGFVNGNETGLSRKAIGFNGDTTRLIQDWLMDVYNAKYDKIVESKVLSAFFNKAMTYFNMDTNEIIKDNMTLLYDTYCSRGIEIGTIRGLKKIHVLLFSGVSDFAGQFRTQEHYYYSKKAGYSYLELLDSTLHTVESMGEDSFEAIISKYIQMMIACPFIDGNKRAGSIWANLMLNKAMGMMIDWSRVNQSELHRIMSLYFEDKDYDVRHICDFLKIYLSTDFEKRMKAKTSSKRNNCNRVIQKKSKY